MLSVFFPACLTGFPVKSFSEFVNSDTELWWHGAHSGTLLLGLRDSQVLFGLVFPMSSFSFIAPGSIVGACHGPLRFLWLTGPVPLQVLLECVTPTPSALALYRTSPNYSPWDFCRRSRWTGLPKLFLPPQIHFSSKYKKSSYQLLPLHPVYLFMFLHWLPRWLRGKEPACNSQETRAWSLGWEDSLEEGMATHSSILAWRILWQRSLAGFSPWGRKESNMTKVT